MPKLDFVNLLFLCNLPRKLEKNVYYKSLSVHYI
jgi:hypothetical protein